MTKNTTASFAKGMAAGVAAGAVAVTVTKVMLTNKHNLGKGSAKAVRAVGDFINGIQTMIK